MSETSPKEEIMLGNKENTPNKSQRELLLESELMPSRKRFIDIEDDHQEKKMKPETKENPFLKLRQRIKEEPKEEIEDVMEDLFNAKMEMKQAEFEKKLETYEKNHAFALDLHLDIKKEPTITKTEDKPINSYLTMPKTGNFKLAYTLGGKCLYLPYNRFKMEQQKIDKSKSEITMLNKSVYALLNEIEIEERDLAIKLSEQKLKWSEEMERELDELKMEINQHSAQLWVDKYRPEKYSDLISDEKLNIEVMKWVKHWEPCLFEKQPSHSFTKMFPESKTDRLHRPEMKILLIGGMPGLGKTTLAHVIAKQCHYQVIEINASDDRSGDIVKNKIKTAIESRSVFADKKPNLIVIDEIDGATGGKEGGFIKALLDLLKEDDKQRQPTEKKKKFVLKRPIICICNDLYAPQLRPLKQVAKVLTIRPSSLQHMTKRLKFICDHEGLKTDTRALGLLIEKADFDIRSCLNTLQFIHQKFKSEETKDSKLTLEMIKGMQIGKKDQLKSIFYVWEKLFQVPSSSQVQQSKNLFSTIDADSFIGRLVPILNAQRDFDRVFRGCFEFYLQMEFRDPKGWGSSINDLHSFIGFYDQLQRFTYQSQYSGISLQLEYMPYILCSFYYFCAKRRVKGMKFEFPKQDSDNFMLMKHNEQMIYQLMEQLDARHRQIIQNQRSFTLEFLSPLLKIMSPPLRPVTLLLMTEKEKQSLKRLAQMMNYFGLRYLQQKNEHGNYVYLLDPPIESLVQFTSFSNTDGKVVLPLQNAVRQLISQQIDLESIRSGKQTVIEKKKKQKVSKRQLMEQRDFFGRIKEEEIIVEGKKEETQVRFIFHEGSTNAVKRNVLMKDIYKFFGMEL